LKAGKLSGPPAVTWQEFRQPYQDEHLSGLSDRTFQLMQTVTNQLDRICSPSLLIDITSEKVSTFQAKLRAEGKAEATIGCYSRHLKSMMRWAVEVDMIQAAPKIRMPKRAKGKTMKGRPITTEEFERLLMVTPSCRR
jgi:hypothetical protein